VIGFEAWSGFLGERRACVKLSRRGEEVKKFGGKNCLFFCTMAICQCPSPAPCARLSLSCHASIRHDALVISLRGVRANLRVAVCKGHDYLDVMQKCS
jgi:hypothetical protein